MQQGSPCGAMCSDSSVEGSPTGAGRNTNRLTIAKIVAFAPIPSPIETTATSVIAGFFASVRTAYRRSRTTFSTHGNVRLSRLACRTCSAPPSCIIARLRASSSPSPARTPSSTCIAICASSSAENSSSARDPRTIPTSRTQSARSFPNPSSYSVRNACIGSIEAARRAGTSAASNPQTSITRKPKPPSSDRARSLQTERSASPASSSTRTPAPQSAPLPPARPHSSNQQQHIASFRAQRHPDPNLTRPPIH